MDEARFEAAISSTVRDSGIGTLGEKTLHAVLKRYVEPDDSLHEVKVGRSVVDVFNADGIVEIQTRSFLKLCRKLPLLLETAPVTVVYPLPHKKWVGWVNPETGETGKLNKSPKTGRLFDCLYELSMIRGFLNDSRLSVRLMLIDMEEYRNLDGWGNGGKRGSSRNNRLPLALFDEYNLCEADDYRIFLPNELSGEFTLKEYMKTAKLNKRTAQAGVYILREVGLVEVCGKSGRENLYRTVNR